MLSHEEITGLLIEHLQTFGFTLLMTLFFGSLAWRWGFFEKLKMHPGPIRGEGVIMAFFMFVIIQAIIVPFFVSLVLIVKFGSAYESMIPAYRGWIDLIGIIGSFFGVCAVFFRLPVAERHFILGEPKSRIHSFWVGMSSLFLIYPFVQCIGQLVSIVVLLIFQQAQIDQVAVEHLKDVRANPSLYITTFVLIITLVPLIEEMLFRGFLQSWLRMKLRSPVKAISLTSLIFAFFHYSPSQGITNIELLISLYILSCFLGYLYEKTRSLWASIGLHATFNAVSAFLVLFE